MQPLNPFLRSFFASKYPAQCSPSYHFVSANASNSYLPTQGLIQHQVLLVPTTDFLLNHVDAESQTPFSELCQTEEFLASHILRIPTTHNASSTASVQNVREGKAKTKQYNTLNGRSVVVKESFVYSNKGASASTIALQTG